MGNKIFLRQWWRSKTRIMSSIALLCAVTGFFTMSVNLYLSSRGNLALVEETFSTIAIMELYGDVDQYGKLTDPGSPDYEGNFSVAVEGYDLTPIITAAGVESYDLRSRYAAYLPKNIALQSKNMPLYTRM